MRWMIACVLLCTASFGAVFTVTPYMEKGLGSLAYRLESRDSLNQTDYSGNSIRAFVQSELEYPLNQFNAGLRFDYKREAALAGRALHAFAGGFSRVSQPTHPMKDSDWIGVEAEGSSGFTSTTSRIRQKFSYTESDLSIAYYGVLGGASLSAFKFFGRSVSLGLSFRLNHFYSDITGIRGWQSRMDSAGYFSTEDRIEFDTLRGTKVLTYEADFLTAAITGTLPLAAGHDWTWDLDLEFAPLSMAWDEDYHLLRHKRINSETNGIALRAESRAALYLSEKTRLEAGAGYRYIRNSGTMEQTWYLDEAYDGDVVIPQGTRLIDIPAQFLSLTGWLSLGLTLVF